MAEKHYLALLEKLHQHVRTFFRYDGTNISKVLQAKESMRDVMEELTLLQQSGEDNV